MNSDALILREGTATSGIIETARAAADLLADEQIPHLVVGGLAVQEHGYPRVTLDVDLVVPDVQEAALFVAAPLYGPFRSEGRSEDTVRDRRNQVLINFLPAGRVLRAGCKVPFPYPTVVSENLQIVSLEELISLKIDSWANSPLRRLKDQADVVELIIRRTLGRNLAVNPAVKALYEEIWDKLAAEKA